MIKEKPPEKQEEEKKEEGDDEDGDGASVAARSARSTLCMLPDEMPLTGGGASKQKP